MKKYFLLMICLVTILSCRKEKEEFKIQKIKIILRASYYYIGEKEKTISSNDEIEFILKTINSLKNIRNEDISINYNKGFLEIRKVNGNEEKDFFSIIFTHNYGNVIRLENGKYFQSKQLVDYFKEKMKIREKK